MATTGSVGSGLSRSVGDGNGGPSARQGLVFGVMLIGWALVAVADGGQDWGIPLAFAGPAAAAGAVIVGAPLAAFALGGTTIGSGPARVALVAAAGLVGWSALSIGWAVAPELAWIETNRAAIALVALALGVAAAASIPNAAERFPVALAGAAALPVGLGLLTEILPTVLGDDSAAGRLSGPVGYPNAFALVAAMALPGVMLWCRATPGRLGTAGAAAATAALLVAVVLTLSRGGIIAAAVAIAVTLALSPSRRVAAMVGCALVGALAPAIWGVTRVDLTRDGLDASTRASAGAILGIALVAGMVVAGAIAYRTIDRIRLRVSRTQARRIAVIVAVGCALTPLAFIVASTEAITNCDRGAVTNDPGRVLSVESNQRGVWWCQAARGWRAAPLVGNGAGSFPVVQLRERSDDIDAFRTREPHQVWLGQASALGAIGLGGLIALWGTVAWAAWRVRSRLPAGPTAIVVAAFVQAQTDLTFSLPVVIIPVMAAVGLVVAAASGSRPRPRGSGRTLAFAAIAVAAVLSAAIPFASTRFVATSADAQAEGRRDDARDAARQAAALNPFSLEARRREALALLASDQPAAIRALRTATDRQPENPEAWSLLARTLEALGRKNQARTAWGRVHALDPYDRTARIKLGIAGGPPDAG